MTTFELVYPRYIHSEVMTHRVFARNAQSSRAVPVNKTLVVNEQPVTPIVYGLNKTGMSSSELLSGWKLVAAKFVWSIAAKTAKLFSKTLSKLGLHKQWANRVTEPFSTIKVIITATDFANFFWLRLDADAAQPEIVALAEQMKMAYDYSIPQQLDANHWHMPYVTTKIDENRKQTFYDVEGLEISPDTALKVSASCCAQVSFRNLDETLTKALEVYDKLFSATKPHLSPTEHQGCVMPIEYYNPKTGLSSGFPFGATELTKDGKYKSGNLTGFVQYRQVLEAADKMLKDNKL